MMRIQPISTTVTLLMAAIVFGAPLLVNVVMAAAHAQAGKQQDECSSIACLGDGVDVASNKLPTGPL